MNTIKATEAAVAAVQQVLSDHFGYDIEDDEREALSQTLVDAAAPHVAAQAVREAADWFDEFSGIDDEAVKVIDPAAARRKISATLRDFALHHEADAMASSADRIEAGR